MQLPKRSFQKQSQCRQSQPLSGEYSKLKGTNHRLQEGNSCWTKRKSSWVQRTTGTGTWARGCSVSILGDFQNSDRWGSKHPEQSLQLILLRGLEEPGPETTKAVSSDQLLCDSDTSLEPVQYFPVSWLYFKYGENITWGSETFLFSINHNK